MFTSITRDSGIEEHRQDPIPLAPYQQHLDQGTDDADGDGSDMRYWSDFNRVYYHPRTVQKLSDPMDWENVQDDWVYGEELFARYDEVFFLPSYTS